MAKNKNQEAEAVTSDELIDTAPVEEAEAVTNGLVKMYKDGEHLHVHPTTVEAHKSAGWKVA